MATLSQIRAGLKTRLETISGLRVSAYVTHQVNLPQAMIGNIRRTYHQTFGSPGDSHPFAEVTVVTGTPERGLEEAQADLDAYCDTSGAKSILAAIEGDCTLGGLVDDLEVRDVDQGLITLNGINYIGATWTVEVYT